MKIFFFFFLESTCAFVLGPWPWPRASLSLASRVSVLGKAVLGLGLRFFLCPWPWPWPRALCPRLHLWSLPSRLRCRRKSFAHRYQLNRIFHYTRCITPKRVTSLRGLSPRHCALASQLLSKKRCSGGKQQHCG